MRKIEADAAARVLETQTKSQNDAMIATAEANARAKQIETQVGVAQSSPQSLEIDDSTSRRMEGTYRDMSTFQGVYMYC